MNYKKIVCYLSLLSKMTIHIGIVLNVREGRNRAVCMCRHRNENLITNSHDLVSCSFYSKEFPFTVEFIELDCIVRMIKPHESNSGCVCSIAFHIDKPLTCNLVFYNVDVSHALAIYDAKRLWRAHMLSWYTQTPLLAHSKQTSVIVCTK